MDLSAAQMPAFLRFHRFHEDLNRRVKVGVIGLEVLASSLSSKVHDYDSIKDLCYSRGDLWGGMPDWSDSIQTIADAKNDLGAAGVLRAFSAFDVFLEQLSGEMQVGAAASHSSRSTNSKEKLLPDDEEDENDPKIRLTRFYSRFKWAQDGIESVFPLYTYFRLMRNCLAHSDGRVTPALVTASTSTELKSAEKVWKKRYAGKSAPASRPQGAGQTLDVRHRDALLASSVLRDVADDLNKKAVSFLGSDGLIYLAAHRAVRDSAPHCYPGVQPYSLLTGYLNSVLRLPVSMSDVAKSLARTQLKEKFLRHQKVLAAEATAKALAAS